MAARILSSIPRCRSWNILIYFLIGITVFALTRRAPEVIVSPALSTNADTGTHQAATNENPALAAFREQCIKLKDPRARAVFAEELYRKVHDIIATTEPHKHYLGAYGKAETDYWTPHIPEWMLMFQCEMATGTPPQKHLDIGIAYGTLALYLHLSSHNMSKIYGADFMAFISPALIAAWNIHFDILNVEVEEFEPYHNGVDSITLTETLEHFHFHPVATFTRMRNILRDNGVLFLSTPNGGDPGYFGIPSYESLAKVTAVKRGEAAKQGDAGHVYEYGEAELVAISRIVGFVIDCSDHSVAIGHITMMLRKTDDPNYVPLCKRSNPQCLCKY